MQNKFSFLLTSLLIFLASLTVNAAENLTLDNEHSYVLWSINHLGFSTQTGKWYVNGQLSLDKEHPEKSHVMATIHVADFITGIPELDKHLKEASFFDVKQFPQATFNSTQVEVLSKNHAKVHGDLTIKGIKKPAILDVTINKIGRSPITHKMTVGFKATTTLKRSDFGINAYLPELGDEVQIEIGAEAFKNDSQEKSKK